MSKRELVSGVERTLKQNKLLSCSAEPNVSEIFPSSLFVLEKCFRNSIWDLRNLSSNELQLHEKLRCWWCWIFFLWETFLAECQYSEGNWGQDILSITCDFFFYLFFLPKLGHIVQEFLKISISRCPRWGMQKHLFILETFACSIQILAADKRYNFKVDTVPKVFWQLFKRKSPKHVSPPSLNVLLYAL